MKIPFIDEAMKSIFGMFDRAWNEHWLLYIILGLVLLFAILMFMPTTDKAINMFK